MSDTRPRKYYCRREKILTHIFDFRMNMESSTILWLGFSSDSQLHCVYYTMRYFFVTTYPSM
jgi:hypothetical protein